MYHFTADHPPEPVRLSFRSLIMGHIRQYLKNFQLDAVRFMHNFLTKKEFCVYNDESGLGKQAAVVVLLHAACSSRRCLIVVQNDDRYINGWEFHFNVLTNTNVTVIKDEKDTTDSPHSVYIAKWSTLRTIDDLSKFKFDYIILDNRGQMLNNSFCTSMLLKHYERRINILISSVDITSDLKLLHNVLRLGGRLEPQYSSFKIFEEKFKLPDAKELAYKRVDLEDYFCKRERLADYCKAFRLRRYCHQFETQLPLVNEDRFKINLDLWREKQNATNSESSSIEYVSRQNRVEEEIKDTQELFEEYCRQRRKEHLQFQQEERQRLQQREQEMLNNFEAENDVIYNVDDEVALINDTFSVVTEKRPVTRDNSDEPILMSPLMVESDSDIDDNPEICNDLIANIEIVDLSSEEKEEEEENHEPNIEEISKNEINRQVQRCSKNCVSKEKVFKRSYKKRNELARLEENIADTLKLKGAPERLSRHAKTENKSMPKSKRMDQKRRYSAISKCKRLDEKKVIYLKNTLNVNAPLKSKSKSPAKCTSQRNFEKHSTANRKQYLKRTHMAEKEGCAPFKTTNTINGKFTTKAKKGKKFTLDNVNKIGKGNIIVPLTSRTTRSVKNEENISNEIGKTNENHMLIKHEVLEATPHTKTTRPKDLPHKVNIAKVRLKREMRTSPLGPHVKQTRSMNRLTRSVRGSKYFTKNVSLKIDKISKSKTNTTHKGKRAEKYKKPELKIDSTKHPSTNEIKNLVQDKESHIETTTQTSIISHRSSQEYESLQCAQRLSGTSVFDNGVEKCTEFLVPAAPNAAQRNSLIPSSLISSTEFLTESGILFIPPCNPNTNANRKRDPVISLSSSDNENSISQSSFANLSSTSRRTRALKPKRNQQQTTSETSRMHNFSDMLNQQNTSLSAKSPDLFSNCSDFVQLPCTQPNLDSEEPNTPFEGFKIFGSEVKQLQQHYASKKNNANNSYNNAKKSYRDQRSCLDILEKMFDPLNKKSKQLTTEKSSTRSKNLCRVPTIANKQKSNTQILPSHPIEVIAEARQQQEVMKRLQKSSTITSSSPLQDDDVFEITNNGSFGSVMRLHANGNISPVQNTQKPNGKQHNKITNYLIGNAIQNVSQGETNINSTCHLNMETATPSKRHQQSSVVQNINVKKSPKSKCNTTQATKLTKWFTKPSERNSHEAIVKEKSSTSKKTTTKRIQINQVIDEVLTNPSSPPPTAGKRVLKRRRLVLSFNK